MGGNGRVLRFGVGGWLVAAGVLAALVWLDSSQPLRKLAGTGRLSSPPVTTSFVGAIVVGGICALVIGLVPGIAVASHLDRRPALRWAATGACLGAVVTVALVAWDYRYGTGDDLTSLDGSLLLTTLLWGVLCSALGAVLASFGGIVARASTASADVSTGGRGTAPPPRPS